MYFSSWKLGVGTLREIISSNQKQHSGNAVDRMTGVFDFFKKIKQLIYINFLLRTNHESPSLKTQ